MGVYPELCSNDKTLIVICVESDFVPKTVEMIEQAFHYLLSLTSKDISEEHRRLIKKQKLKISKSTQPGITVNKSGKKTN